MDIKAKISKNVTAICSDWSEEGKRSLVGYLKEPKKDARWDAIYHLEDGEFHIDESMLEKYGIKLVIEARLEWIKGE